MAKKPRTWWKFPISDQCWLSNFSKSMSCIYLALGISRVSLELNSSPWLVNGRSILCGRLLSLSLGTSQCLSNTAHSKCITLVIWSACRWSQTKKIFHLLGSSNGLHYRIKNSFIRVLFQTDETVSPGQNVWAMGLTRNLVKHCWLPFQNDAHDFFRTSHLDYPHSLHLKRARTI